jgi:selenocysteine lyase/cysteine desulfurase
MWRDGHVVGGPSLEGFRSGFPILRRRVYVNNCSQGALSTDVEQALRTFIESWHAGGSPWDQWMGEVERLRALFAAAIGADVDEVAVMPNATTAAAAIATALSFDGARREVLLSGFEFPTMAHLWQAQARRGAAIVWAGRPDDLTSPVDRFAACLSERTCVVPVAHVSFRTGRRLDVARLVSCAHAAGAMVLLDDYQHTGTLPLDVHALDVDALVTGTLNYLLGPPGVAFLYVRRPLIERFEPLVTGWFGRADPFAFALTPLDWSRSARRFETGSPAVAAVYGAAAGLSMLREVGPDVVAHQIARLVGRMVTGAKDRGFQVFTPDEPAQRSALVVLQSGDAQRLVRRLQARGVITSARGTGLRVSFHAYNNDEDVDRVLAALDAERALLPADTAMP